MGLSEVCLRAEGGYAVRTSTSRVSIVMPAYNEAARLSGSLEAVLSYVRNAPDTEIIVVDDGSTDATAAIAERTLSAACTVPWRVLRSGGNRGKGHAVRT